MASNLLILLFASGCLVFLIRLYQWRSRSFEKVFKWIDDNGAIVAIALIGGISASAFLGFHEISATQQVTNETQSADKPSSKDGLSQIESPSLLEVLYKIPNIVTFNLNYGTLEKSNWLILAAWLSIGLALLLASQGVGILFHKSLESVSLKLCKGHTVVIGLGRIGSGIIDHYSRGNSKKKVVVIETDHDHPLTEWAKDRFATVIHGDATKANQISGVNLHRASEVFIATGDDAVNVEVVLEIRDYLNRIKPKGWRSALSHALVCHVHIVDNELADLTRGWTALTQCHSTEDEKENHHRLKVNVFSSIDYSAIRILQSIVRNSRAFSDGTNQIDSIPHFIFFGLGSLGQCLAANLIKLSSFPCTKRVRVTCIDNQINEKARGFLSRYPVFARQTGGSKRTTINPVSTSFKLDQPDSWNEDNHGISYICNTAFVEYVDIADDDMFQSILDYASANPTVEIFPVVCFDNEHENLTRAARLRDKIIQNKKDWSVHVSIQNRNELSELMQVKVDKNQCKLIPFGVTSASCDDIQNSWMNWLARCIELIYVSEEKGPGAVVQNFQSAVRDHDIDQLEKIDWVELDRESEAVWDGLEEWMRASNRASAMHAILKAALFGLRITGCNLHPKPDRLGIFPVSDERFQQLAKMEHYRWVSERLIAGWRYSAERDDIAKTRWQICTWEDLAAPPEEAVLAAEKADKRLNEQQKDENIVNLIVMLIDLGLLTTEKITT